MTVLCLSQEVLKKKAKVDLKYLDWFLSVAHSMDSSRFSYAQYTVS